MAKLLGYYDIPDDLLAFVDSRHVHGGAPGAAPRAGQAPGQRAAPSPPFPKVPPGAVSPDDMAALEAAIAGERESAGRNALAQNLFNVGEVFQGRQARAPVAPVPTDMRDFLLRRQLAAEGQAAEAARAPVPPEWGAPAGLTRSEALAQGWAKKTEKPVDPFVEEKRIKLQEEIEALRRKPGEAEKDRASRERAAALAAGQRDRALDIQEKRAEAAKETAGAKRRMVSDAQVKDIATYDRGIRVLEDIMREKPQVETGPVANARNWLGQKVGMDDPQVSSFKAQVNDFLATYIRSISGAATTDKERAFLLQNMPKLSDNDRVFQAKTERTLKRLRELRGLEVDLIRRQGKDTSEFEAADVMQRGEGMPPPPGQAQNKPAAASPAPAPTGGTVVVIWKGKRKEIPAERLDEALKAGAQRAE